MRIGARNYLVLDDAMEYTNLMFLGYNILDVQTHENENAALA